MTITEARKCAERQRFPMAPLERLIPHIHHAMVCRADELAVALGVSARQVLRYQRNGLSEKQADRLACRLGLVPELIDGWSW